MTKDEVKELADERVTLAQDVCEDFTEFTTSWKETDTDPKQYSLVVKFPNIPYAVDNFNKLSKEIAGRLVIKPEFNIMLIPGVMVDKEVPDGVDEDGNPKTKIIQDKGPNFNNVDRIRSVLEDSMSDDDYQEYLKDKELEGMFDG